MFEFTTSRQVEFVDTDMGGIVHFSRFFIFMETAEHEFMKQLGTSVHLRLDDGRTIGWPRVSARCDYMSPARFGDLLEINVRVLRKGRTSLTYGIRFSCDGRRIADGQVTAVCCELEPDHDVRAIPIPGFIADKIVEAPE